MLQHFLLPFRRRAAVAAHGGKTNGCAPCALEPAADFADQNLNTRRCRGCRRHGDAFAAQGARDSASPAKACYFLGKVGEARRAGGLSFQNAQCSKGMRVVQHRENSR